MKVSSTSERLNYLLRERNLKQVDILKMAEPYCNEFGVNLSKVDLSQYISGKYEPKQIKLNILALALGVSEAWLMGFDVPMERLTVHTSDDISKYGLMPIEVKKIPLLGEIACGEPIYASEDRESYVIAGTDIKADFALKAKGDSMIGARIMDGDIVFIRRQSMVDNGEIAAVIIEDEATLKRVYYYPEDKRLILQAENAKYPPFVYQNSELDRVRILGKAIAFQSDVV